MLTRSYSFVVHGHGHGAFECYLWTKSDGGGFDH